MAATDTCIEGFCHKPPFPLGHIGCYDALQCSPCNRLWTAQRISGSSSQIVFEPLPGDDPKQRRPDITKAKAVLGWEPQVQLEEGLRRTVAYFRGLDLRRFKKPTGHTAHANTAAAAAAAGRAALAAGSPAPADPAPVAAP
mmetsp:Transcript_49321/g.82432  ORF Transcript_49321/g.82432 Transcript_49321/m.82432 type:complete len:141 (+) Transcript_49321:182-604(+)